jgi:protein-L-isoaspartate(D-aspartate) O-methyltransferase
MVLAVLVALPAERAAERERMVREQIEQPPDYRTRVSDPVVLEAMRAVPRHAFVPRKYRGKAYDDTPLPIGHGQTISQPYIVAAMTELLAIGPESRVLEIGTGSGYQAAVLAQLTPYVFSVEIIDALADRARDAFREHGYEVRVRNGDGYFGWTEYAPFDAIIVTCAAGHLPPPLWEQLKPGGRIVIPIGNTLSVQRLVVVEKDDDGRRSSKTIMGVRFVPMTGYAMETDE